MAGMDKINFNISPELKRDIERLAHSYGKTLSAFLLDVCKTLVDSNKDRIKEQTEREKQPINFGGNVQTTKPKKTRTKTKKAAQSIFPEDSVVSKVNDKENTVTVHTTIEHGDTQPRTVTIKTSSSDENVNGVDDNG